MTWTWPWTDLPEGDVELSPQGKWVPVQGAKPKGVVSNHIACAQFCDIANRVGVTVVIAEDGSGLQLQFSQLVDPLHTISSLSPLAPIFNYTEAVGHVGIQPE